MKVPPLSKQPEIIFSIFLFQKTLKNLFVEFTIGFPDLAMLFLKNQTNKQKHFKIIIP